MILRVFFWKCSEFKAGHFIERGKRMFEKDSSRTQWREEKVLKTRLSLLSQMWWIFQSKYQILSNSWLLKEVNFQNQKDEYERHILELEKKVSDSKVTQTDSQHPLIENKKDEEMKKEFDIEMIHIEKERKIGNFQRKFMS